MFEFTLGKYTKTKIWFSDNVELLLKIQNHSMIYNLPCKNNSPQNLENRTIILEFYQPRGGRIIYGLLGAKFKYLENSNLNIQVNISDDRKKTYNDSFINKAETAYIGMPQEYSSAVYNGLKKAYDESRFSLAGEINYCFSAYSDISSNFWVFEKLSYMIYKLLQINEKNMDKSVFLQLYKQVMSENKAEIIK